MMMRIVHAIVNGCSFDFWLAADAVEGKVAIAWFLRRCGAEQYHL